MMPGIFLNCLLTSTTTEPPALPTACMPIDPNRYGNIPPISKPATTNGFDKSNVTFTPAKEESWTFEKYFISSVYAAKRTKKR